METTEAQPDPATIWAACDRHIHWHEPRNVYEVLHDLVSDSSPAEQPDRYGDGSLIQDFEAEIAETLGKEAALFLPSGTMAQQVALRVWAERTGRRTVAFHPTCHLELHEYKAYEVLHGLRADLVGDRDRLITLADLERLPEPPGVLLLELPQREIGGQLPTWEELQSQLAWARERGTRTHMDGARLWESAPFYGRSYAEIAAGFDSVYVSFYKGLGAIGGAALAGPADFIAEARPWVRRHGGMLFGFYPYVVSARRQLRRRLDRFQGYHERAVEIAGILDSLPGISVKPNPPHANMMHVFLAGDRGQLINASLRIAEEERVCLFQYLKDTPVPGYWSFELAVGDAAASVTNEEIRALFEQVMDT
jgi:threonine aldolase